ncbi:hypothetical protein BV20DRAFT_1117663 [Pilatotrama ljubarskyi]|nr:hypothetical protein BV20DRAFT_1117663 [Pilatotrama ljubarskyi]
MSLAQAPATHTVSLFRHPLHFPSTVWASLEGCPQSSNIIYAHAAKLAEIAIDPDSLQSSDLWIVCWTTSTTASASTVDFILSCTEGPLGAYPIFIFSPPRSDGLASDFIEPRIKSMVAALGAHVAPERVFSVFALDAVADAFAAAWTAQTGVQLDPNPVYYHAKFMQCTKETFIRSSQKQLSDQHVGLRPAVLADVDGVARLCHGFAAASEPFVLTEQRAHLEAITLILNGQVWVHTAGEQGSQIACIVAVTRTTDNVAAITKVYTCPEWRSRGCAERLVRHVCGSLLQTKESIVLYVAHNNPAAAKVYERVGFIGFESCSGQSADSWKELGFDRDVVQVGHW